MHNVLFIGNWNRSSTLILKNTCLFSKKTSWFVGLNILKMKIKHFILYSFLMCFWILFFCDHYICYIFMKIFLNFLKLLYIYSWLLHTNFVRNLRSHFCLMFCTGVLMLSLLLQASEGKSWGLSPTLYPTVVLCWSADTPG